jgi:selenocysteine-specific elongation factor
MAPDRASRVAAFIELSSQQGLRLADLAARTGWNDEVLSAIAAQLAASTAIVDCDGVFVASANLDELERATAAEVVLFHERNPLARGLARETLRERHFAHIPAEIFRAVVRRLEKKGTLVLEKDLVRAREYSRQLSGADAQLCDRFDQLYATAALQPPSVDEAMLHAGVSNAQKSHARKVLQILIDGGRLVRVQGDLFFHRKALDELIAKVRNWSNRPEPQTGIDVATFKDLAAVSRKYAIPLLEFLDRERITRREGDRRTVLK